VRALVPRSAAVFSPGFGKPGALERRLGFAYRWSWHNLEPNLSQYKLRLVIVTDELRPEVRRIIDYWISNWGAFSYLVLKFAVLER